MSVPYQGAGTAVVDVLAGRVPVYFMNILQSLRASETFCVTLNRPEGIARDRIIKRINYHHPLYTREAVATQARQIDVNGVDRTYFCGAYWRYGFHEDGVVSALAALDHFTQREHAQRDLLRVG